MNTSPEKLKQIILEELQLLRELKLIDVRERFKSNKWIKTFAPEGFKKILAAEKEGDESGYFPTIASEGDLRILTLIQRTLWNSLPYEASDRDRAELLNWLISWAISSKRSGDERWNFDLAALMGLTPVLSSIYRQILPDGFVEAALLFYKIKEEGLGRFLSVNSISKMDSPDSLVNIVGQAKDAYEDYARKKEEKSTKIDPAEHRIFENSKWDVFIPKTKGAACALGSPHWCTTIKPLTKTQDPLGEWEDPYLEYHPDGVPGDDPLIIFHLKENTAIRFQFSYGKNEYVDKNNDPVFDKDPMGIEEHLQFHELNDLVKEDLRGLLPAGVIQKADQYSIEPADVGDGDGYREKIPGAERWFDSFGQFHRKGDPAIIWYDTPDGPPSAERWYKHGLQHREDGPAFLFFDGYGKVERYYLNGEDFGQDVEAWREQVQSLANVQMTRDGIMENQDLLRLKLDNSKLKKIILEEFELLQKQW